jgi:phosphoribosylpyrophosphate synthetase
VAGDSWAVSVAHGLKGSGIVQLRRSDGSTCVVSMVIEDNSCLSVDDIFENSVTLLRSALDAMRNHRATNVDSNWSTLHDNSH